MQVFDNKTGSTSVRNAFFIQTKKPKHLLFASPYFTYFDLMRSILGGGSQIKLIVGLNEITKPSALRNLLGHNNIQMRFFTSSKFHSKLYIFGNDYALSGSANLTEAGLQSNQEICIGVTNEEDGILEELTSLFQIYWDEAEPIDKEVLRKFEQVKKMNNNPDAENFKNKIQEALGCVEPSGLNVNRKKKSSEKVYLDEYKRTYQGFLNAFEIVKSQYLTFGRRKVPDGELPLRLEVDQFFNYMREYHVTGDRFKLQSPLVGQSLTDRISDYIIRWHESDMPFIFDNTVPGYQNINSAFASKSRIMSMTGSDIFDTLLSCYSFHDRLRYYPNGTEGHKKAFLKNNDVKQLRNTISYLLFGRAHPIERMADCIFDANYKLSGFAKSGVQELLGWVNEEDIPVFNERTGKVLSYLGFDIKGY